MGWTHIEDTKPKARKHHFCELCDRWIEKGEIHIKRVGVGDDGLCSQRMHIECEALTQEWDWWDWETIDPSEIRRELAEASKARRGKHDRR